ncbi:DUF2637 domain-containing protein [Streptomyces tsukubensis]|uniref:DUF2637 domain-containing protein n=1 Tax=Streptomyces tsukubensis TaxID=83656 RepID=UPI0034503E8C
MRPSLRDPLLIQATIAAALSFSHIHDIAVAAGQTGWKAWAYPVSVDLLMVMAWKQIRTPGTQKKGAWLWFLTSLVASLGANVGTSGVMDLSNPPTWLRVIVAGWPAAAFLGGFLLANNRKSLTEEPPAKGAQKAAEEPLAHVVDESPEPLGIVPQERVYVTYRTAAEALGVAPETVRGWKRNGKVNWRSGDAVNSVLVDMDDCRRVHNRLPVGA